MRRFLCLLLFALATSCVVQEVTVQGEDNASTESVESGGLNVTPRSKELKK